MMYDYGKRTPRINRDAGVERGNRAVSATDGNFPESGRELLRLLNQHARPIRNELPATILRELEQPVVTPDGREHPSPESECKQYPAEWANFMAGLTNHPAWIARVVKAKEKVTPRLILDIIRGYHWKGGWLSHQPSNAPTTTQGLVNRAFGDYDE